MRDGSDMPGGERTLSPALLTLLLFTTGAAVLVVEIVGARMISPYFGVSLYVWSALITVTLISLAAGYWGGGRLAELRPDSDRLLSIVLAAAAAVAVVPLARSAVLGALGSLGLRTGALLSAAALFGAPLALLGMVTPYAVRISARSIEGVAALTGRVFALSTVGSVAGALATGFVLAPLLSVDRILYLLSAALAGLAALSWALLRRPIRAAIALAVATAALVLFLLPASLPQAGPLKVVFRQESPYGEVRVIETATVRSLLLNGIVQGQMAVDGLSVNRYPFFIDALVRSYHPGARDVLVVGLGMGAYHALQRGRGVRVDTVEIDPVVCAVAKDLFGYRDDGGRLVVEDGRWFLGSTAERYDAVVIDAFSAETLPIHLFSHEAFRSMARALRPGGIVALNIHDFHDQARNLSFRSLVRTMRTVFQDVRAFEIEPWREQPVRNIALLASQRELVMVRSMEEVLHSRTPAAGTALVPIPLSDDGVLLTDAYNPLDSIYRPISENMRALTQAAFPPEVLLD